MPFGTGRLRGIGRLIVLGGSPLLLGAAFPVACSHRGGGLGHSDAGGTGGADRVTVMDAAATGGAGGQVSDGSPADHPIDPDGGDAADAGAGGMAAGGAGGTDGGEGGGAGSDGGTGGSIPSDGSSGGGGGGAASDGGSPDVMFPCGPCSPHWVCGGYSDAAGTDVTLTPEEDGCYLAGLSGHALLAPDGTVTENGVQIGRAQKFGPQVGFYHPDGSSWFYCGGNLPCSP